ASSPARAPAANSASRPAPMCRPVATTLPPRFALRPYGTSFRGDEICSAVILPPWPLLANSIACCRPTTSLVIFPRTQEKIDRSKKHDHGTAKPANPSENPSEHCHQHYEDQHDDRYGTDNYQALPALLPLPF